MAVKRIDWIDIAQQLDRLVSDWDEVFTGMRFYCTLSCYGGTASFTVGVTHSESKVHGYGDGRTPAKALDAAKADLQKKYDEWLRTPRLESATKALT